MASVIAGRVAGVAKDASINFLRVLDCNNETTLDRLLLAFNQVATYAKQWPGSSVVNLSISGPSSSSFNTAVANLVNVTGVTVVGAAGNDSVDACTTSPASEPATLTVGAVNGFDQRSTFSNYGSCVDISAPGTNTDAVALDPLDVYTSARARARPGPRPRPPWLRERWRSISNATPGRRLPRCAPR